MVSHYPIDSPSPTLVGVQLESGEIRWTPTRTGVHQGDPLGPALFALALNAVLERTVGLCGGPATFENAYIGAVLDDVCIVAPPTLARTFCNAFVQANSAIRNLVQVSASTPPKPRSSLLLRLPWMFSLAVKAAPGPRLGSSLTTVECA